MIIEVKVPQLSESVSEATLLDWHKKEGESVARDENLIDIETDKVVLELPAPADGVLVRIMKKTRDSVGSGDVIAQIDTEARAGADVAPAPARGRAAGAVAVHGGHPHHIQRSEHAAGDRAAQEVPGAFREGARHPPGLHVVLREGGRARAEALSRGQRVDRRHGHR